jgi:tryptophan halogenase
MTGARIWNVVIVGGGTAGWMAASALARFLGAGASIRLIESDEIGRWGWAKRPSRRSAVQRGPRHRRGRFPPRDLGTFKLGIDFVDWLRPGHRYMHAFGSVGRGLGLTPFHHFFLRHRSQGGPTICGPIQPAPSCAGETVRPARRPAGRMPSGVNYAFHFDASLYAAYLRRYASARRAADGGPDRRCRPPRRGRFIEAVTLGSGERVDGESSSTVRGSAAF